MALIEERIGRRQGQDPSGYTRLFGVESLGSLLSRVQGAVISSGSELEKLIWERVRQIDDLDSFVLNRLHDRAAGVWVATKRQIKRSSIVHSKYEPDFVGFRLDSRLCFVVEVKDGDTFDTKKSAGEHESLHRFSRDIAEILPFAVKTYLCGFNSSSVEFLYQGLKRRFDRSELLTGQDLCDLFEVGGGGYSEIVGVRTVHQQRNLLYFVDSLVAIPAVRSALTRGGSVRF